MFNVFFFFFFRPGKRLVSDDEVSSRPVFVDDQSYNHDDSDIDLDTDADLPAHIVVDLEELNKQNIRDQEVELRLPPVAKRLSMDLQQIPLQKLAVPLIAAFNKVCPHTGNQFKFVTPQERLAFASMITSASILPTLEYFLQFSISDLTSIYRTLIDTFTEELISFHIFPGCFGQEVSCSNMEQRIYLMKTLIIIWLKSLSI